MAGVRGAGDLRAWVLFGAALLTACAGASPSEPESKPDPRRRHYTFPLPHEERKHPEGVTTPEPLAVATAVEAPAPICEGRPAPAASRPRSGPLPHPFCSSDQREIVRDGWALEVISRGATPVADGKPVLLVWSDGCWRSLPVDPDVPGAGGLRFNRFESPDVDADGAVVFAGRWMGHKDQQNGVGGGIYRLDGDQPRPLVDAFTMMPGKGYAFNELGIPDIDGGSVAFYGSRNGGEWGGVYLWTPSGLRVIADKSRRVDGTETPRLRAGRLVFGGREAGRSGFWLYTLGDATLTRLIWQGDQLPGLPGEQLQGASAPPGIGEEAIFFSVLSTSGRHVILGWHRGSLWTVAHASFFDAKQALYVQTSLSADGSAVAFAVGAGPIGETWVAEGCRLERVVTTGDRIGDVPIKNVFDPSRDALRGGVLELTAQLANGETVVLRARRRSKTGP